MSRKKSRNDTRDNFFYEKKVQGAGYRMVAGIDEAGRGPLAGPVVAAAVVVNDTGFVEKIDDSKKLTEKQRERACFDILKRCDVGVGVAGVEEIDKLNILNATLLAMKRGIDELKKTPDYLLIDGKMNIPCRQRRTYLMGGESLSLSIACASVMAKVFRDRLMIEEDRKYPRYGFKRHKGYGTRAHMEAIRRYGLCDIHRQTFGPFGTLCKDSKGSKAINGGFNNNGE